MRTWLLLSAANGFIGVAAGAFAAHALKARLSTADLALVELASRYQLLHALALIGVAWLASVQPGLVPRLAGVLFTAGIVLFCGSLYGLGLGAPRATALLAPFGGTLLLAGWLALGIAAFKG